MAKVDILHTVIGRRTRNISYGEKEFIWRLVWIAAIAVAAGYISYVVFGGMAVAQPTEAEKIIGVDVVKFGQHRISGVVIIPSSCHGLSVTTEERGEYLYHLSFSTWQEPSRVCPEERVSQAFNTVVFAPPVGITFTATLDGRPITLDLVAYYQ